MKKTVIFFFLLISFLPFSSLLAQGTLTTFTTADGLVDNRTWVIAFDSAGTKWMGTTLGISSYDGTTWTNFTNANTGGGLLSDNVWAMTIDSSGTLWFATGGGVSSYNDTTWTAFTTADGLVNNDVRAVEVDPSGTIWFGTLGGVSSYDGTTWTTFTTADGLVNNDVLGVAVDSAGTKWFATSGGLSSFDGTTWTNLTTADGIVNAFGKAVEVDLTGTKWIMTNGGVNSYVTNLNITATTLSDTLAGGTNGSVTLTFTNQTSLSSGNEIAITFPSGFDVSGAGINGGSTVATGSDPTVEGVSGQVVTLNVHDSLPAGSQTIVLTGIDNPTSTASGLSLTVVSQANNGSATIDQADATPVTFLVRAHLNLTATSLDNSFTNATGVTDTVTFTTITQLDSSDEIVIDFPTGFDVSGAAIDASTAATGSDPTLEGVSGQIVTLNVPDTWTGGSQTIVLTGIDNPSSAAGGLSLGIKSQSDGGGADIDLPDETPVTFSIVQSGIDLTATSLSNNFTHAIDVQVTIIFTTTTPLVSTNEISVTFPAGFDVSGAAINAVGTVTSGSDPTVEPVAGQVITLNVPDAWSTGSQTIVLTGIDNPISASSGIYLTVVSQTDGAALTLDIADRSPPTFDINQSFINLTSTTLSNSFENATNVITTFKFTNTTPLVSTDEIEVSLPAGFRFVNPTIDTSASTVKSDTYPVIESSIDSIVILSIPDSLLAGSQTLELTGVVNPDTAAENIFLNVITQTDGGALALDFADQTPFTFGVGVILSLESIETQSIIPGKTLSFQLNATLTN